MQLSRRDQMFTEQKRLLKAVKEEYQEKFNVSFFFRDVKRNRNRNRVPKKKRIFLKKGTKKSKT